ncbi:MAG: PepSY domain-containing protein [Steroidobacteraceae bacterium]
MSLVLSLSAHAQRPGSPPDMPPSRAGHTEKVVPLNDVVSMVQERFNATAVKTDSVLQSGVLTYRIRLLSADRSRVWTVNVDARTGQIN